MLYFKKFIKLPGPVELGMSDHDNAMASEFFRNNAEEYTWEQYYAKVQELHPVKFFLASTVPTFFRHLWVRVSFPVKDAIYYLKCHVTTRHRYHLLDLRQEDGYQYGWLDGDRQILYACFRVLENYIEEELPNSYVQQEFTEEELANDPHSRMWYEHYQEVKALYHYWKVERPAWLKKLDTISHQAHLARQRMDFKNSDKLYEQHHKEKEKFEAAETDALCRLIKTRKGMWT